MNLLPRTTGKLPSTDQLVSFKNLEQFNGAKFINRNDAKPMPPDMGKVMTGFFKKSKTTIPPFELPSVKTDLKTFDFFKTRITWFGHSSYIIQSNGKNILVDPVFSGHASPFSFMVKAFKGADQYTADDMPEIDLLILTHDHYDHMDYKTLLLLTKKVKQVICPVGVGAHLKYWGYAANIIHELYWYQSIQPVEGIKFTSTPAQHMSGRAFRPQLSLWSSYVLELFGEKIFIGGDSGYADHFSEIGERFGPFDLVILENGQYNDLWPVVHTRPYETAQAAIDLKAKAILPVHWAKFALAFHAWDEPIEQLIHFNQDRIPLHTPKLGGYIQIDHVAPISNWWK